MFSSCSMSIFVGKFSILNPHTEGFLPVTYPRLSGFFLGKFIVAAAVRIKSSYMVQGQIMREPFILCSF